MQKTINKFLFILFILTNNLYSENKIIENMKPFDYKKDYSFESIKKFLEKDGNLTQKEEYSFEFLKDFLGKDGNFTQNVTIKIYCDDNLISLGQAIIEKSQTTLSPTEFMQSKKIKVIDNNISTSNELYQLIAKGIIDNIESSTKTNFIFDKNKNLLFDKTENEIYAYFGFKKTNSYIDKEKNKVYETKLYSIEDSLCFEHQELDLNTNTVYEYYYCNNRKIQNLMPRIQTYIYSDLKIKIIIEGVDALEQQENKNIFEKPIKIIVNKKCTISTFLSDYSAYLKERKNLLSLNKKESANELDEDFKKKLDNCPAVIDYVEQLGIKHQEYLD